MTSDARIQHVLDHLGIQAVITAYARGQDSHQADNDVLEQWDQVFTDDATTDYTVAGAPLCSYRELAVWMRGSINRVGRMSRYHGWQHMLSIPDIAIDGDRATARTDFLATHKLATTGPGGTRFDVSGAFHDELLRTTTGWRIQHRRLEVYFAEEVVTRNSMTTGTSDECR